MTEPSEIASVVEPVVDGVWHWRISNSAIGGSISSSHAVRVELADGRVGCVFIDPVRLDVHAMQQLPPEIVAVVLTAHGHQRSAWRIRREHGAKVWAPEGSPGLEEEPDGWYRDGSELPGGLVAIHTPGPEAAHFSLLLPGGRGVIVSDLLQRAGEDGELEYGPFEHHEDPDLTRASVRHLASFDFELLLLDHGAPIAEGGSRRLAELVTSAG